MSKSYHTVVIGAGPGGYVAALRAAAPGRKVAIVEYQYLGGTCLNWGCIPTKTLLHTSETVSLMTHTTGIKVKDWKLDFAAMMERKNGVIKKLRSGINSLLKGKKVDIYNGKAKLDSATTVTVTDSDGKTEQLQAESIIIATGSVPAVPPVFPQDRSKVMTSDEILALEKLPKSLMVVGGGVIGCEFATLFAELGVKVTVVEMMEQILPPADKDVAKTMTKVLKGKGIDIHTGVAVESMELSKKGVTSKLEDGQVIDTELVLVSIGRRPYTQDLGLENANVKLNDKGFIEIDDFCCTNVPNIYAIGDVTGKIQLAHVASRQANVAANNILGNEDAEDYAIVPSAVYTHPEIAWVGMTLEQAKEKGLDAKAATFPMMALGMAMAYDETEGFVKVIIDQSCGAILGAHLICPHASDIIQEIAVLMKSECTVEELASTIHGHPTFAESLAEVSEILLGNPLHGH